MPVLGEWSTIRKLFCPETALEVFRLTDDLERSFQTERFWYRFPAGDNLPSKSQRKLPRPELISSICSGHWREAGSESREPESENVPAEPGGAKVGLGSEIASLLTAKRESSLGSTTAEATAITTTAEAIPKAYGRQFLKQEVAIRRLFSPSPSGVKRTPSAEALSKNLCR